MAQQSEVGKFINKYAIFIVLIVMVVVLSFLSPAFLTPQNLINVLITESGRGILAIGVAFTIISRGIDLSVGSIVSLTSVIAASLVQDPSYSARAFSPTCLFCRPSLRCWRGFWLALSWA